MKKKLFRWLCLLLCLSIVGTSVLLQVVLYLDFSRQLKAAMVEETRIIGDVIEDVDPARLAEYLEVKKQKRITVIGRDGDVLYDSMGDAEKMENHMTRPEILAAMENGVGEDTRYSSTINSKTWYYAVKLKNGEILRLAETTSSLFSNLLRFLPLTVGLMLAMLLLALAVANRITRRFVAPINSIDPARPEEAETYEELAPLITTIRRQNATIEGQMKEMRARQVEFAAITDHMQEGVIVLDRQADMLSSNKSAMALLEMSLENTTERNFLAFHREPVFRKLVHSALKGRAGDAIVERGGRDLQLFLNPVQEDTVTGAVLLIMDITERREREKLRREFTANVSHELRTPLTSISGYAEIIMKGIAKQEDIPGFSQKIYQEAQRLISLIGDILLLSRLDETEKNAPRQPVDMAALCRDIANRLSAIAEEKGVTIETAISPCEIYGVASALDELVYNLCENAVKYNKPGGKVKVRLELAGENILLQVSDTGIGIPKGEQQRVFERFYRVDKSRESNDGTGLGLSIAKHAALLHGAKIQLTGEAGIGTIVEVRFPNKAVADEPERE